MAKCEFCPREGIKRKRHQLRTIGGKPISKPVVFWGTRCDACWRAYLLGVVEILEEHFKGTLPDRPE